MRGSQNNKRKTRKFEILEGKKECFEIESLTIFRIQPMARNNQNANLLFFSGSYLCILAPRHVLLHKRFSASDFSFP